MIESKKLESKSKNEGSAMQERDKRLQNTRQRGNNRNPTLSQKRDGAPGLFGSPTLRESALRCASFFSSFSLPFIKPCAPFAHCTNTSTAARAALGERELVLLCRACLFWPVSNTEYYSTYTVMRQERRGERWEVGKNGEGTTHQETRGTRHKKGH